MDIDKPQSCEADANQDKKIKIKKSK